MGELVLILVFVVIVIGGIGLIKGVLIGVILVGLIDMFGGIFLLEFMKLFFSLVIVIFVGLLFVLMVIYILMVVVLVLCFIGLFGVCV